MPQIHIEKIPEKLIANNVNRQLTDLLFAGALNSNILVIIASLVFTQIFSVMTAPVILYSWCGVMILLAFARLVVTAKYKKIENPQSLKKYYTIFTIMIGIGWGSVAFFPQTYHIDAILLIICLFMIGIVFVGIIALSMNFLIMVSYVSFCPVFLAFALFLNLHPYGGAFAMGITVYWLSMMWLGFRQHQSLQDNLTAMVKNEILIERLYETNEQALSANKAKDDFLANMSHELRTPMNGILGMTRLAIDMKPGKEQTRMLANVLYSAESLLGILNDILDFSKISAAKLQLLPQSFNLQLLIDNIIASLTLQATEKHIFLKSTTDFNHVPVWIVADELRLQQILVNLIGNAIKFTHTGGVTIEITCNRLAQKEVLLTFSITDTGIGLASDKQKVIFDSFSQADTSTTRNFGGTGLGLAISKQLVEMMGGKIGIISKLGEGSEFSFTIDAPVGQETPVTEIPAQCSKYKGLRILLVEDNEINQELARLVLEQDGQQVVIAADGLEALATLCRADFDLILMDLQMPKMDGLMTTTIIRSCERNQGSHPETPVEIRKLLVKKMAGGHIPIIAMTANVLETDQKKCRLVGMDDFLGKPFSPKDLYTQLNNFPFANKRIE